MKTIIWILIIWAVLYMLASFVMQDLNPYSWTQESRFLLVICFVVSAGATVGAIKISEEEE